MNRTLDIADPLLREAEDMAARDGTTLLALVEQGLRVVVAKSQPKSDEPYQLVIKPFKGTGLRKEFKNATPDQWLEAMYGEPPGLDRG